MLACSMHSSGDVGAPGDAAKLRSQAVRSAPYRLVFLSNERATTMRHQTQPDTASPHLLAATVLWLLTGAVLLLSTALPLHTDLLGWTPAFWLLGAPLIMLLALQPGLPRQLLLACRPHRRAMHAVACHGRSAPR